MKMTKEQIKRSETQCKQCMLAKKEQINIQGKNLTIWPLFFLDQRQQNEDGVDICATALGVSSLSHFLSGDSSGEIRAAVSEGVSTLLFVRNEDGSWPSKISRLARDDVAMEGVINDTYNALNALVKTGFISYSPLINIVKDPKTGEQLDQLEKRLAIADKSMEWLLDNRAGQGWGYTGTQYLQGAAEGIPAYTVPSANAVMIISQISGIEKTLRSDSPLDQRINQAVRETVDWMCDIQNEDGGFGIKRGERSRVGNTAKVLLALCEASEKVGCASTVFEAMDKAADFILKTYDPENVSFESVSEDFFQFSVETSSPKVNLFKRPIIHELYLEPLVIDALNQYYKKRVSVTATQPIQNRIRMNNRVCRKLKVASEDLIRHQVSDGNLAGAIHSRRSTEYEYYPVYACSDAISAFDMFLKNPELANRVNTLTVKNLIFTCGSVVAAGSLILLGIIGKVPCLMAIITMLLVPVAVNLISNAIWKAIVNRLN